MRNYLLENMGQRIRMAREMRGMTMEGLSKALNPSVTKQAISKYEKGLAIPGSTVLISMSNALDVAPDYFFRQQTISISKIAFNGRVSLDAKTTKAINETVRDYVERYLEAMQIIGAKMPSLDVSFSVDVPEETGVIKLANTLKEEWGLGEGPIGNVIDILERHGIIVIEIDSDNIFEGLSGWINDTYPIIVLDKSLTYDNKRFTVLHELGHILISPEQKSKKVESLCNRFAGEMLISDERLKQIVGTKIKGVFLEELENIKDIYGISIDALFDKMLKAGIITKSSAEVYEKLKTEREHFRLRVTQPSKESTETSHKFVNMVCRALSLEAITSSKAAVLLNVPVSDVAKLHSL